MAVKSVFICCMLVALLGWGSADDLPICGLTTPCKFEVYNRNRVIIQVVDAPCVCQEGTVCAYAWDKTAASQYIHWCKPVTTTVPTTVPTPTVASTTQVNEEL